jgi:hypothetical protein
LIALNQIFHLHDPSRGASDPCVRPFRVGLDAEKRHASEAAIDSAVGLVVNQGGSLITG